MAFYCLFFSPVFFFHQIFHHSSGRGDDCSWVFGRESSSFFFVLFIWFRCVCLLILFNFFSLSIHFYLLFPRRIFFIGHSSKAGLHGKDHPQECNETKHAIEKRFSKPHFNDWEIKWNSQEFSNNIVQYWCCNFFCPTWSWENRNNKNKQQIIQTYQFPCTNAMLVESEHDKRNKNKGSFFFWNAGRKCPFLFVVILGGWRRPRAKLTLLRLRS